MAITVGFMSLVAEQLWVVVPASPYFASMTALAVTAACVLLGGLIAFLMVWVEFSVIQETSALTFMVAGTFKEIVTGVRLRDSWRCYSQPPSRPRLPRPASLHEPAGGQGCRAPGSASSHAACSWLGTAPPAPCEARATTASLLQPMVRCTHASRRSVAGHGQPITMLTPSPCCPLPAVVSAVIFLGDDFGLINAVGLVVLVFGAALFNYSKYRRLVEKDVRAAKGGALGVPPSPPAGLRGCVARMAEPAPCMQQPGALAWVASAVQACPAAAGTPHSSAPACWARGLRGRPDALH